MKAGNLQIKWRYAEPITACFVTKDGSFIASQRCECAKTDHFCKDTGRKLSLSRTLKEMKMPKEERKVVWELYRNMKVGGRW
jgi:hypothetical protein